MSVKQPTKVEKNQKIILLNKIDQHLMTTQTITLIKSSITLKNTF
jgi:hypothetical protein